MNGVSRCPSRGSDCPLWRDRFRRFLPPDDREVLMALLRADVTVVADPQNVAPVTADPDDDYLVALAQRERADVLVSGDSDLTAPSRTIRQSSRPPRSSCSSTKQADDSSSGRFSATRRKRHSRVTCPHRLASSSAGLTSVSGYSQAMTFKHHTDPELRRALERWIAAEESDLSRLDAVRVAAEVRRLADQVLDQRVLEARACDWPWAQIAKAVGVTRQSAHRRWRHLEAPARALAEDREKRFHSSRWPPAAPWTNPDRG